MKEVRVSASEMELRSFVDGDDEELRLPVNSVGKRVVPLTELDFGMDDIDVRGTVVAVSKVRTFDRDSGEEGRVRNVRIQDSTTDARVAFWGDQTEFEFGVGDTIHIFGADVREGMSDEPELSVGWSSRVEVLSAEESNELELEYVTIELRQDDDG